jgi:hypothetical protein
VMGRGFAGGPHARCVFRVEEESFDASRRASGVKNVQVEHRTRLL